MEDKIPVYRITIDPEEAESDSELGIDMIAFTKTPAILTKGFAFKSTQRQLSFNDAVKQRIVAPAMIPMEIYRYDEFGEYYVQFTAEEIERLHSRFMQTLATRKNVFNLEHDAQEIAPAYILEAWLVGKDPKADRSFSEFGIEVPTGTLMLVAQVTDTEYYNELVQADRTGFSIEGILGMALSEILKKKQKHNMKKYGKRYPAKMADVAVDDAQELTIVADSIEVGNPAIIIDAELTPVSDWTGELVVEGATIKLENGVITEVMEVPAEEDGVEIEIENAAQAPVPTEEEVVSEDTTVTEEVPSTYALTPEEQTAIVSELMQILEPKFEEVYNMIAEIKSAMAPVEEAPVEAVKSEKMSIAQRLSAVERFLQNPTIN